MEAKVYLVGAGPGDPGLITLKGQACLAKADVIIYDFLAASTLLGHASDKAELIYVGKKGGDHTLSQEGINQLLVDKALQGLTVVRLKGGDPFIFGRGGEEAEVLIKAGIAYEIVPGVTSAIAAPAYAGIPLTHRKYTSTLAFVTGHEDPSKNTSQIDWTALAKSAGTLVFLMGVKNLPQIIHQLAAHGVPPDRPVALIRWGTTAKQQTVTGNLENIVELVQTAGLKAPAIVVVGEVVGLRSTMQWFEPQRPLLGKTVVVTRARQQASDLVQRLTDLGAECLECPTIRVAPPADWSPVDDAIRRLSTFNWLVFTSVNGVNFFFKRLFDLGYDVRAIGPMRTACIGPATARRLYQYGINSDIIPESYMAEAVVDAFADEHIIDQQILLPRAAEARSVLPTELRQMGATVVEVTTYQTKPDNINQKQMLEQLEKGRIDLITFTSSSTAKNFKALLPSGRMAKLLQGVKVASIGPITSGTARDLGFNVDIHAEQYTIAGLCEAIVSHYRSN